MTDHATQKRPVFLALFLMIAGAVGLVSAWALTVDKFELLKNPQADLDCNFSLLVQCGKNLDSWQGSLFGVPNPLLGLVGFTAVIVVGAALLAGARFSRWFWLLFNLGIVGAFALVVFLITQSIFVLGTLCPWCMTTWLATIPLFWAVTFYNLKTGNIPTTARIRRLAAGWYGWIPFVTLASYIAVAVIAQLRLDVISYL